MYAGRPLASAMRLRSSLRRRKSSTFFPPLPATGAGRGLAATRAPDLLVVALDGARHVAVDDIADVGLVDAHAEGHRGDDDVDVVALEGLLRPRARLDLHAGMVGQRLHALLAQELRRRLDGL